ncbi:MAG: SWIM zinc finger family protein [Blastocatellia bacterium]|nr:SWIM zinc finger family protein [Blastocatellia bacterium]MCS7156601.1 SWIM zinc finger family protein [Blastocatellia bacterium]MCX7751657.1 SWIM zinc finger family protein [Blastocatellia bacterium]MDW8168757.1 SWIM zinc finger family protein [Acidobacteriota bacterium]MDW8257023.1 SWIM zinc finger family protein [Acidobacteriota bacterium]
MPDLRTLSARDIEGYAESDAVVERGRCYHRSGRVQEIQLVTQDHLRARVRGQLERSYRVEVWTEGGELHSQCSCPYWGVCKHVVAVLFAWLDQREELQSGPSAGGQAEALATWVEALPTDLLRDLLLEEIRMNSALEEAFQRWRETLRPERLPHYITLLFRRMFGASSKGIARSERRIAHLLTWAKTFDPEVAGAIVRETFKRTVEFCRRRPDVDPTAILEHALGLIEAKAQAFERDPKLAVSVLRDMVTLFLLGRASTRALLEPRLLALAGRWDRRADVIAELKEHLLEADTGAHALLAKLCRLEGLIEEYETARHKSLVSEEDYLELFDHYLQANYPDRAIRVGEQGIKVLGTKASRLAERLAALYQEWGETARAERLLTRRRSV